MDPALVASLADIVRNAAPLLIASQGELITERAGVVNLSLDGTILLAAMAAFVVSFETENIWLGILVSMMIGMLVALIIIASSVFLKINQIAVGFVLTILCADLSAFLGRDYAGIRGEEIPFSPIPLLEDIPIVGEIFFQHNIMIYFSLVLVVLMGLWLYHTRYGLLLRGLGERPQASYVRGIRVQAWRFVYVAIGGALVGLAGAAYSLSVKLGWREGLTLGNGWIALAIVIFGAWRPYRILVGAYLIVGLRTVALYLQREDLLGLPVQIINLTPWILMLITLMVVSSEALQDFVVRYVTPGPLKGSVRRFLRSRPPAALGTNFERQ